jgi:P-type E1-E2 ATPase
MTGDIIYLKEGDQIGADSRLIQSQILGVDEALLTGETHQVDKNCNVIAAESVAIADQLNMVFASTTVTQGHGRCVVVRTVILDLVLAVLSTFSLNLSGNEIGIRQNCEIVAGDG